MSDEITINVKLPSQEELHPVTISGSAKVKELKERLADKSGIAVDDQRLMFKGRILKDD
jgi:Ubiquitin family